MNGAVTDIFSHYPNPLKISEEQRNFLISGTYKVLSAFGTSLLRKLQIIGSDPDSGNILVRETYSDATGYSRIFVLSPDGKTEKYRGQFFAVVR